MSGGAFNYECFSISRFAEDLEAKLKEDCYKETIPDDIREVLENNVEIFRHVATMARDIEWYFSDDYGNDCMRKCIEKWPKIIKNE